MELNTVKKKELRGELLRFLAGIYPEGVIRESVFETFFEYYKTEYIEQEMAYLVDKGYVARKDIPTPFGPSFEKVVSFRLTPSGRDVLDGTLPDTGIQVRR